MASSMAHEPQKLRSSCNACAEAKIGCTKEKPTCSRCARRDEPCVYAVIRRAGRPSLNKNKAAVEAGSAGTRSPPATVMPPMPISTSTRTPNFPVGVSSPFSSSPHYIQSAQNQIAPDYSDLFASMMTTEVASPLPMESISRADLDDFLASIAPPPSLQGITSNAVPAHSFNGEHEMSLSSEHPNFEPELFPVDFLQQHDLFHPESNTGETSNDNHGDLMSLRSPSLYSNSSQQQVSITSASANWFSVNNSESTTASTSIPHSDPPVSRKSSVMNLQNSRSFPTCGCLPRALAVLNNLAPSNLASTQTKGCDLGCAPSFEDVMLQNEETIEAIKDILDCSCSKDGSLLFTLSLIVFKTLGWYAAAALAIPPEAQANEGEASESPRHSRLLVRLQPTSMLGYDVDGENQKRIICQLVLSKLHSVQRIVNLLSQRLLALVKKKQPTKSSADHIANAAQDLLLDEIMFNHSTSGELARDLEAGLRCRLRELCQAIMDTLVDS